MKTSILLRNVHNWQICVHENFLEILILILIQAQQKYVKYLKKNNWDEIRIQMKCNLNLQFKRKRINNN